MTVKYLTYMFVFVNVFTQNKILVQNSSSFSWFIFTKMISTFTAIIKTCIRLNVILMWKKSDLLCYLKGLSILAWNLRIYYKKKPLRNWDVYSTKGVKGTQKGILKNVLVQSHKELKEISWGTAEQLVPILQSYSGPFFLCPYRICLRVIVVIRTARIC